MIYSQPSELLEVFTAWQGQLRELFGPPPPSPHALRGAERVRGEQKNRKQEVDCVSERKDTEP